jgi:hypothetical protein
MNWIKKLIPAYVEVRSLYWVNYSKKMDAELNRIFESIDNDDYVTAEKLIAEFESKHSQGEVPLWVAVEMAAIHRAKSMLNFLNS